MAIPKINNAHGSDTRNIINKLIETFNKMGYTYDQSLQMARNILNEAQRINNKNVDVQSQIDDLILRTGESDAEVINARGDFELLRHRLENIDELGVELQSNLGWNLENVITNGDFRNNLTGWNASGSAAIDTSTPSSTGKSLKIDSTNGDSSQVRRNISSDFVVGHKYFVSVRVKVDSYTSGSAGYQFDGNQESVSSTTDGFIELSGIHEYTGTNSVLFVGGMNSATLEGNIDNIQAYDLTEVFGAGKEVDISILFDEENKYIEGTEFFGLPLKSEFLNRESVIPDQVAKQTFMDEANKLAERIGMSNSHFITPSGQGSEGHISTTNDLLRLGVTATAYNDLVRAWSRTDYTFNVKGKNPRNIELNSTVINPALDNRYRMVGGKTGTVSWINSLISVVERPNSNDWLVGVVQGHNLPRFGVSADLYDVALDVLKERERVTPTNIIVNGDFSQGSTGWTINSGNPTISNGKLIADSTGTSSQMVQKVTTKVGHKYYLSAEINITRYASGVLGIQSPSFGDFHGFEEVTNGIQRKSEIRESLEDGMKDFFAGGISGADLEGTIENIVVADLTEFYGAGNEPTKEEFEAEGFKFFGSETTYSIEAPNAAVCLKPVNGLAYEDKPLNMLYTKNGDTPEQPASTTKVLTALTMIEHTTDLNEVLEIKDFDITADGIEILAGDKMTLKEALYCMMLPSSNIVANAVARHVGEKIAKRNLIK